MSQCSWRHSEKFIATARYREQIIMWRFKRGFQRWNSLVSMTNIFWNIAKKPKTMCDVTTWLPYDGFSPKSNRFICGQIVIELKSFMKIFQEMWTGACTQTYKQTNLQTYKKKNKRDDYYTCQNLWFCQVTRALVKRVTYLAKCGWWISP